MDCLDRRPKPNKCALLSACSFPGVAFTSFAFMESSNDRVQDPAPEVSPVVTGVSFPTLTFASLSIAVLCLAGSRLSFHNLKLYSLITSQYSLYSAVKNLDLGGMSSF